MTNRTSKLTKRILAAFLSAIMVLGLVPVSMFTAFAATNEHPDAVTIFVKDEDGNAVEGATVQFSIDSITNGDDYITGSESTDANGCVEILPSTSFVTNDMTVTATVSKTDYADNQSIVDETIVSGEQNIEVTLISTLIKNVTIESNSNLVYTGNPQSLVSISGTEAGDTVTYKVDDVDAENAEKTDADTYKVEVTVKRDGFTDLVKTFSEISIAKAEIENVDITAKTGLKYDEGENLDLVDYTDMGIVDGDTVEWYLNGVKQESIPKAFAIGNYTVKLVVKRNSNYNDFEKEVPVSIALGEIELGNLNIAANELTYDSTEQKAINITNQGNYTLKYSFEETGAYTEFTNDANYPTVKDAGDYTIYVKAVKENYSDKNTEAYPINVTVKKANQKLEFVNANSSKITLDNQTPANNVKDFSATPDDINELNSNAVTYSLIYKSNDNVATINENTGIVTFSNAGIVTVKALREGNKNYEDAELYFTITVNVSNDGLVFFDDQTTSYQYDENGVVSEQSAKKLHDGTDGSTADNGALTYLMSQNDKDKGFSIDSTSGKVTVSNRKKLEKALKSNGTTTITVNVSKAAGTVTTQEKYISGYFLWFPIYETRDITSEVYPSATSSYDVVVSYGSTLNFDDICTISNPASTGWYNADNKPVLTVKDSAKYSVAIDSTEKSDFDASQEITTQGENSFLVYFKDLSTKKISAPVTINIKVDTEKPSTNNMKITYSQSVAEKLISAITFWYYKPSVTVTFEADDSTSGVDYLNWKYTKQSGESSSIISEENDKLTFDSTGKATLTLTGSDIKQYRGNMSFTVTDKAGNTSEVKTDDNHVIVVDTINPTCNVEYTVADQVNGVYNPVSDGAVTRHYYNGSVDVTFTVTENNFYTEDFDATITKDGGIPSKMTLDWSKSSTVDNVYIGKYTIIGDGDYIISANYKDRSGNQMADYTSEEITIDTVNPEISLSYSKDGQKATFTVKEHNFCADDIVATVNVKDVNGNVIISNDLTSELQGATWTQSGNDTYTYETTNFVNGFYNIKIDYKDFANRTDSFTADEFIVDHANPSNPEITYSTPLKETALSAITFGFYNPTVTVTFTSYDEFSGVDYFTWSYTRQTGASDTNVANYSDIKLQAEQDSSDKSKYTASVELPLEAAQQLRGSIACVATDTYKNASYKTTDSGKVLVVDTIAPTCNVEYSEESNKVGTTLYYGNDKKGEAEVTFNITESNFFEDDVIVKVSKDGASAEIVTPTWTDVNTDKHVGKITLSGDGHYVVYADYTDRSNNQMVSYQSDMITIDTIKPVIAVEYENQNKINQLKDKEENDRGYFDKTQTAIVTITEHNFNADDVVFSIVGKDVTGLELNNNELIEKSTWNTDGDVHKITITYSGDANYDFDVEYTDLATNKADDYKADHFTVDKVAPTVTKVEYSTSVLETVLESLTFGFYNAKMTITITAEDQISGVHKFDYSYINAANVSKVNAELLNQAIEEADINYSSDRKTATMSFEIPKYVLGNDNQFNGTVEFASTDRSGNKTEQKETKRVIVDNIAPTATVTYNTPVNQENNISYYDGNINGTITVNEANFYSSDVVVTVTKDGGAATTLPTTWKDESVDVHIGTFTLTDDADYVISVTYKDKSGNEMVKYQSNQLTIDTKIEAPTYTINGTAKADDNGGAYKDDITVSYSFADQNYDSNTVKLTRTRFDKTEDVTSEYIKTSLNDKGGSGTFTFAKETANDGIYVLTATMKDKAGHNTESHVKFTVNRYGSVYEYSDYLVSLIKDGGQYIKKNGDAAITQDIVITEYNADRISTDSLKILITRDGEKVDTEFKSNPVASETTQVGESGWYQYEYTISKSNFEKDGVYNITLTSKDNTGNESTSVPENSFDSTSKQIADTMKFTVDTTTPEIRNIVNLDKEIVNAQELNVKYTVVDIGGLAKIEVLVDGKAVDTITDFGDDLNNFTGDFTISESNSAQTVQLKVTDLAGNITDTASDSFNPGDKYVFNDEITVSTNFFVRWYANTPLFWGSIGGVVVLTAGIWLVIAKRKKKSVK